MQAQEFKILIVDRRSIIGSGISAVLNSYPDFTVVGNTGCPEEALCLCEFYQPDIVTVDPDLPGDMSGVELIRSLHYSYPKLHIVVLTNLTEEEMVREALHAGALSYLLKNVSAEELAYALRSAIEDRPILSPEVTRMLIQRMDTPHLFTNHLTQREDEILQLVSQGKNNSEIAKELRISLSTVQFHVSNVLAKLNVHNRIEAATFAVRQEMVRQGRDKYR